MSGHRYEPETNNNDKSPFDGLFSRYTWMPPTLMMIKRILGIIIEFITVHAKPYTTKEKK